MTDSHRFEARHAEKKNNKIFYFRTQPRTVQKICTAIFLPNHDAERKSELLKRF